MRETGRAGRPRGETLFKICWFAVMLGLTAAFGAGWALAIYALVILLILALVGLFPCSRR